MASMTGPNSPTLLWLSVSIKKLVTPPCSLFLVILKYQELVPPPAKSTKSTGAITWTAPTNKPAPKLLWPKLAISSE